MIVVQETTLQPYKYAGRVRSQARSQVHNQEGSEACRSATGRSRSRPCWAPPCLAAYPAYSPPPTSHPTWPSSKAASLSSSSSPPPRSTNQTLCWTLSHTQGFSTCLESSRDQSTLRARTTRLGLGDLCQDRSGADQTILPEPREGRPRTRWPSCPIREHLSCRSESSNK